MGQDERLRNNQFSNDFLILGKYKKVFEGYVGQIIVHQPSGRFTYLEPLENPKKFESNPVHKLSDFIVDVVGVFGDKNQFTLIDQVLTAKGLNYQMEYIADQYRQSELIIYTNDEMIWLFLNDVGSLIISNKESYGYIHLLG